jgi:hypothetical protein
MKYSTHIESTVSVLMSRVYLYFEHLDWRNEARLIGTATLLTGIMSVSPFLLKSKLMGRQSLRYNEVSRFVL